MKSLSPKESRKALTLGPSAIAIVGVLIFLVLSLAAVSLWTPTEVYATSLNRTPAGNACEAGYGLTPEGCVQSACIATGVGSSLDASLECSDARSTSPSSSPSFPTNSWMEYATYAVLTKELSGNWIVPKAPKSDNDQTIFLFIGSQQGTWQNHEGYNIIQPVLQWGESADGGGNYWAVASWYVNPITGEYYASTLVRVNVGDTLLGNMTSSNCTKKGCDWVIVSEDLTTGKSTTLNLGKLLGLDPPQHHVYATLEVYNVQSCSDYPASNQTGFFSLLLNSGHTTPTWKPKVLQNDGCGEKVRVINSTSVNLHY